MLANKWTEEELKACAYTNKGDEYRLTGNVIKDRIGMIFKYLEQNKNLMPGNRHNVIHLLYNYLIQCMNKDEAAKIVYDVNSNFGVPLRNNEIECILRCHDRKNPYKYKLDSFLCKLDASFTIKRAKCITGNNFIFRQEQKKKNKEKKQMRNRMIIQTYIKTGTFAATAKKCRVCINTVKSVLKSNPKALQRFKRQFRCEKDRLAFSNFCKYKDIRKAAKKGRCSIAYTQKLVDKYTALKKNLYIIIKEDLLDRIPHQVWLNKEKYGNFYKRDYLYMERIISDYTGLEAEDINIALAPYIRVER